MVMILMLLGCDVLGLLCFVWWWRETGVLIARKKSFHTCLDRKKQIFSKNFVLYFVKNPAADQHIKFFRSRQ